MSDTQEPVKLPRDKVIANRIKLLAIMAVFAVPVLVAYLGFFGGWFQEIGRVNKGELLNPTVPVASWQLRTTEQAEFDTAQRWWLVLVRPEGACDHQCELQLITLRQTWLGLGKHQERVNKAALGSYPESLLPESTLPLQSAKPEAIVPAFYIVDPLGNVVLRYALPLSEQDAIDRAKAMRADFAKLLRYSRIG